METVKGCNKDCPDRNAYCHSYCEKYLKFHQQNEVRKNELKMQAAIADACYEFGTQARKKRKRRKNLQ